MILVVELSLLSFFLSPLSADGDSDIENREEEVIPETCGLLDKPRTVPALPETLWTMQFIFFTMSLHRAWTVLSLLSVNVICFKNLPRQS